jgi:hypothetical protein
VLATVHSNHTRRAAAVGGARIALLTRRGQDGTHGH